MLIAISVLTLVGLGLGLGLGWAARVFRVEGDPLADQVDALLPQTQCAQCGYAGCRPYAEAISRDEAEIDLCPPGGDAVLRSLADLLGREPGPLNPQLQRRDLKTVVRIDEQRCIGCTLCIQACPVDAIVGAAKLMHTVIEDECTGCDLCLPPCPVDCIDIVTPEPAIQQWRPPRPRAGDCMTGPG
jgi:electron transport complex protein RnfB